MRSEDEVLNQIREWAGSRDNIRAVVLTGSRADPKVTADALSDYDLDVYVRETEPIVRDDGWLRPFGQIMVRWPLRPQPTFDERWITQLVLFEDGVRIDFQFTVSTRGDLSRHGGPSLVIANKDQRALSPPPESHIQHPPIPPSAEQFQDRLNAFWWDIPYVAKALRRGELNYAKYMLDSTIRFDKLLPLMTWSAGVARGWSVDVGIYGRWLHYHLDEPLWARYLKTFSGASIDDNWRALFETIELVRAIGTGLADSFGYDYPHTVDANVTSYIRRIQRSDVDLLGTQ